MKIFSSLVAFAMVFACLSVAFADVALPPRPRDVQSSFVTADITDDGKLSVEINFPYECGCKYRLVDKNTGDEIFSDEGTCDAGDIVTDSADLRERLSVGENFFLLTIEMFDIKAQTRFGTKTSRNKNVVTKTIVVTKNLYGKRYNLRIYDGDQTVSR